MPVDRVIFASVFSSRSSHRDCHEWYACVPSGWRQPVDRHVARVFGARTQSPASPVQLRVTHVTSYRKSCVYPRCIHLRPASARQNRLKKTSVRWLIIHQRTRCSVEQAWDCSGNLAIYSPPPNLHKASILNRQNPLLPPSFYQL